MILEINFKLVWSLLIPFLGTTLGSAMVFLLRNKLNEKVLKLLIGFASGVMIAASIWSLLQPAIETFEKGDFRQWLVPSVGFSVGIIFLILLDRLVPHMHVDASEEGLNSDKVDSKSFKMILAVTIHNIPEGLAVGLVIAGSMGNLITAEQAFALSLGIAIQNFPEGAIISMPLKELGVSKPKAFILGTLSGIVEPIASLIAIGLTAFVSTILPYTLSFAAGAMIYVVCDELIPEANQGKKSSLATIGLAIGFIIMMILDIALG